MKIRRPEFQYFARGQSERIIKDRFIQIVVELIPRTRFDVFVPVLFGVGEGIFGGESG